MTLVVNYSGKDIELIYSGEVESTEINSSAVKGIGISHENYQTAEEIAWSYLIDNARLKKPYCELEKIIGINEDFDISDGTIKIFLRGIPVYKNNKQPC